VSRWGANLVIKQIVHSVMVALAENAGIQRELIIIAEIVTATTLCS
jgi:hypothetical protein